MDWKHLLAYITGTVDQELLLRHEADPAKSEAEWATSETHRWDALDAP